MIMIKNKNKDTKKLSIIGIIRGDYDDLNKDTMDKVIKDKNEIEPSFNIKAHQLKTMYFDDLYYNEKLFSIYYDYLFDNIDNIIADTNIKDFYNNIIFFKDHCTQLNFDKIIKFTINHTNEHSIININYIFNALFNSKIIFEDKAAFEEALLFLLYSLDKRTAEKELKNNNNSPILNSMLYIVNIIYKNYNIDEYEAIVDLDVLDLLVNNLFNLYDKNANIMLNETFSIASYILFFNINNADINYDSSKVLNKKCNKIRRYGYEKANNYTLDFIQSLDNQLLIKLLNALLSINENTYRLSLSDDNIDDKYNEAVNLSNIGMSSTGKIDKSALLNFMKDNYNHSQNINYDDECLHFELLLNELVNRINNNKNDYLLVNYLNANGKKTNDALISYLKETPILIHFLVKNHIDIQDYIKEVVISLRKSNLKKLSIYKDEYYYHDLINLYKLVKSYNNDLFNHIIEYSDNINMNSFINNQDGIYMNEIFDLLRSEYLFIDSINNKTICINDYYSYNF